MIDIDSSWNPEECSLDEHRQKILATIEQPGFGIQAKPPAEPVAKPKPKEPDSGE